jgi:hypothetical protein
MDFRDALKNEVERAYRAFIEAKIRYETLSSTLSKYESQERGASSNGHRNTVAVLPEKSTNRAVTGLNKSSEVRQVFIENHASGLSSSDAIAAIKAKGLDIADTYIYSLISRWNDKGQLESRGGKHYPTDAMLNAQKEGDKVLP